VLVLPKQSFNAFIRHQFQALIVCFFIIKNKEEAIRRPAEARQRSGEKWQSKRFLVSCRTGLFSFDSKRNKTAGSQLFI